MLPLKGDENGLEATKRLAAHRRLSSAIANRSHEPVSGLVNNELQTVNFTGVMCVNNGAGASGVTREYRRGITL